MKRTMFLLIASLALLSSCERETSSSQTLKVTGLMPVYAPAESWDKIVAEDPRPIQNLGKIFYKDHLIYVVERLKGIHVINNSDPANPIPVKFISIAGNRDISMKGNYLYAANAQDLVVLDVTNLDDVKTVYRHKDLYETTRQLYPEFADQGTYFQCPDPANGVVIDWIETELTNPQCRK